MLDLADRPVGHIELMKWSFLLAKETSSHGGDAFYDFLPYKLGPFSFCLQRDLNTLVQDKIVEESDDSHWNLTRNAKKRIHSLSADIWADLSSIVKRYSIWRSKDLIDHVYKNHPWYTINSELTRFQKRPIANPNIYTSGYEGLSVDAFLNLLLCKGIGRLIDVRNNPIARRYGFHKSSLSRLCDRLDIDYVHFPELGIESDRRQNLRTISDYADLFDDYETSTLVSQHKSINAIADLVAEKPSVMVCMERHPSCCHRTKLARAVSRVNGLLVIDLREET